MRTTRRVLAILAMNAVLASGVSPVKAADDPCTDGSSPKTCRAFVTQRGEPRWRYWSEGPNGPERIVDYYINPTQPWVSEETAIAAIRAGFANWQQAAPNITFNYLGPTARPRSAGTA